MTLITVVCYDFVIFSRSKSHTFEKSTVLSCDCFSEIPARKKLFVFFLFRPFYVRLKLHDVKVIYPIFTGTNVLSSVKTRLPRILTETL